jgi:CRP-like cAMP-binding protein
MKSLADKDQRLSSAALVATSVTGSFLAMLLLLGILGGYVLGGLMLLVALVTLPIVGIVDFSRWLIRPRAVQVPQVASQPVEEVSVIPRAITVTDLKAVDIFKKLSDQELDQIAAIGRAISVPQGTLLARQGDIATSIYVVLEGQAQLTTSSPQGEITVRIADPGESLPLAALLGSGELITTVFAMSDLSGMEIPKDAFSELLRRQPEIGMSVYQAVAEILGGRYQNTLTRLVGTMEQALRQADVFANV